MKRILLFVVLLLVAGFAWLGATERPAPTASVEQSIPANRVLGE